LVLFALASAAGAFVFDAAKGATAEGGPDVLAEAVAVEARPFGEAADLLLHYIQEDGPESGHVRVVLTPETRPLTIMEARAAAQQAFLEALKEPGLGENLTRITVVVRLMPATHPDPVPREQVIVFQHRGGRDWSVLSGE
jgi:hypothetical protein